MNKIRKPAVAGQFYANGRHPCLTELEQCLPKTPLKADLPAKIHAGIVPHAGWVFSGDLAALVFSAIAQTANHIDTFIIFGAIHNIQDDVPPENIMALWEAFEALRAY